MKTRKSVQCAVYVRTAAANAGRLTGQHEVIEAFIASRSGEGWVVLPGRYEDDGFNGNNADRSGLRRLMDDVAAGKVNRVVVERFDRLARCQTVFAELLAFLRRHGVEYNILSCVNPQFGGATASVGIPPRGGGARKKRGSSSFSPSLNAKRAPQTAEPAFDYTAPAGTEGRVERPAK